MIIKIMIIIMIIKIMHVIIIIISMMMIIIIISAVIMIIESNDHNSCSNIILDFYYILR